MKHLLLFLTLFFSVARAEKIEVFCNGMGTPQLIQNILADDEVVQGDLKNFAKTKNWLVKLKNSSSSTTEKFLFMNVPPNPNKHYDFSKSPKEKMVLFMWEPPLRLREMYKPNIQNCFSRVYTWDDDLVDNKKYFKFYYPVLRPMIENTVAFEEKKFCTTVIGNTCDMSKYSNELYSERKKAIRFFESKECGFEFYGTNWDAKEYPSYRGPIVDKSGTIKNYRFAICYENTKDLNGYVTEKIFDCFASGVIPIYWGANNICSYVPKECFIDKRDFPDLEILYTYLKTLDKQEYEKYIHNIKTYLASEQAQLFSPQNFDSIIRSAVTKELLID